MAYTHVRYIAYYVPTVAKPSADADPIHRIPAGDIAEEHHLRLRGKTEHLKKFDVTRGTGSLTAMQAYYLDAKIRIQRLLLVLRTSRDVLSTVGGDNSNTLKIFLAPEFYFRPDHADVSYPAEVYRAIKDVLRSTLAGMGAFHNWLLVPGTIMWHYTRDDSVGGTRPGAGDKTVYNNTALVIGGGDDTTHTDKIDKVWASSIDGLPTGYHGGAFDPDPTRVAMGELFDTDARRVAHFKNNIFRTGGHRFALEICVDHRWQGVRKYYLSRHRVMRSPIDIHLVVSAGGPRNPRGICVRTGGYFCRVDGYFVPMVSTLSNERINSYNPLDGREMPREIDDAPGHDEFTRIRPARSGVMDIEPDSLLHLPPPPGETRTTWNQDHKKQRLYVYNKAKLP